MWPHVIASRYCWCEHRRGVKVEKLMIISGTSHNTRNITKIANKAIRLFSLPLCNLPPTKHLLKAIITLSHKSIKESKRTEAELIVLWNRIVLIRRRKQKRPKLGQHITIISKSTFGEGLQLIRGHKVRTASTETEKSPDEINPQISPQESS